MKKIEELKWGSAGLIPAVVQDATSGEVLTVAYVSRESLAKTLEIKETVFYSRSRQCLWHKGETSGNTQTVVSVTADCDAGCHRHPRHSQRTGLPYGSTVLLFRRGRGEIDSDSNGFLISDSGFPIPDSGFLIPDQQSHAEAMQNKKKACHGFHGFRRNLLFSPCRPRRRRLTSAAMAAPKHKLRKSV